MSAITVRELVTKWGFDVDSSQLKTTESTISNLKTTVASAAATIAATTTAIYGFASSTAAAADPIAKFADRLGIGIESLQEIQHAAELSGVGVDKVNTALQRFIRRSAEAVKGSGEAKGALEELGVDLLDSFGNPKDFEVLFNDVADAIARFKDPSDRVRLAFKLFDSDGVGLVNLLKLGSQGVGELRQEAQDFGIVISEDVARNSEMFNDASDRLSKSIKGITYDIGGSLLPALTDSANKTRMWFLENRNLIRQNISRFLHKSITATERMTNAVLRVGNATQNLVASLGGVQNVLEVAGIAVALYTGHLLRLRAALITTAIAELAALAPIIAAKALLASIITLVAILIQDIYKWSQGAESVTGDIIGYFENLYRSIKPKIFKDFQIVYQDFISFVQEHNPFDHLTESVLNFSNQINQSIDEALRLIGNLYEKTEPIRNLFASFLSSSARNVREFDKKVIEDSAAVLNKALVGSHENSEYELFDKFIRASTPGSPNFALEAINNITPRQNPIPRLQSVTTDSRSFKIDFHNNIQAGANQSPRDIAEMTKSEFNKNMQQLMNEWLRDSHNEIEK